MIELSRFNTTCWDCGRNIDKGQKVVIFNGNYHCPGCFIKSGDGNNTDESQDVPPFDFNLAEHPGLFEKPSVTPDPIDQSTDECLESRFADAFPEEIDLGY